MHYHATRDTTFEYIDNQLQELFKAMDVKTRTKALRGAFRREANMVRKVAINNLRASGLRTSRGLEKGIHATVWKKKAGFKVSIWGSMYKNRYGQSKPVLIFAEGGTSDRSTKSGWSLKKGVYQGHHTGAMRKYGFMEKTLNDVRGSVTDNIHQEVINSIEREARKYGCK